MQFANRKTPLWMKAVGNLAVLVVALVSSLAYYFVFHVPLAANKTEDEARIRQLETMLQSALSVRIEHKELHDSNEELKAKITATKKRIPTTPQEAVFLASVTEIAKQHGLEIIDYRPGHSAKLPTHSELEVGLKCVGDYAGICRFADQLSKLDRVTTVRNLLVVNEEGYRTHPLELRLVLYFGIEEDDGTRETEQAGRRQAT